MGPFTGQESRDTDRIGMSLKKDEIKDSKGPKTGDFTEELLERTWVPQTCGTVCVRLAQHAAVGVSPRIGRHVGAESLQVFMNLVKFLGHLIKSAEDTCFVVAVRASTISQPETALVAAA